MTQQSLRNDAKTAGEAIARAFVDAVEAVNKRPSAAELSVLERDANQYFAALSPPWVDADLIRIWREAMVLHVNQRIKDWSRPRPTGGSVAPIQAPRGRVNPNRGFGPSFGITR